MSMNPHHERKPFPIVPVVILAVLGWVVAGGLIVLSVGPNGFLTGASGGGASCVLETPASCIGGDLSGEVLTGADFTGARLSGANLSGTDLSGVSLFLADLRQADLSNANLRGADLSGSWLEGANLSGADLTGATVNGSWGNETIIWGNTICPDGSNSDAGPCF